MQLAEPTRYRSVDGSTIKKYTWIDNSIYKFDIMPMPRWLFNVIQGNNNTATTTTVKTIKKVKKITPVSETPANPNRSYQRLNMEMFKDLKVKPTEEEIAHFNILSFDRLHDETKWNEVGIRCFALCGKTTGKFMWDLISKQSPKYDHGMIEEKWYS